MELPRNFYLLCFFSLFIVKFKTFIVKGTIINFIIYIFFSFLRVKIPPIDLLMEMSRATDIEEFLRFVDTSSIDPKDNLLGTCDLMTIKSIRRELEYHLLWIPRRTVFDFNNFLQLQERLWEWKGALWWYLRWRLVPLHKRYVAKGEGKWDKTNTAIALISWLSARQREDTKLVTRVSSW